MSDEVLVDRRQGVVTLTLNRPGRKNAFNRQMLRSLLGELQAIGDSDEDRCVVLTGAGGNFSSGADLQMELPTEHELRRDLGCMNEIILALHQLPQAVIAKVRGVAAGGGMNLAMGCDVVVASVEARFSEIFIHRGLAPDCGGSWLLPRLVGLRKAKELTLFGEWLSGSEAVATGLVNRVVPEEDLDSFVDDRARELAGRAPAAVRLTKELIGNSSTLTLAQALTDEARALLLVYRSDEFQAAIRAFPKTAKAKGV